MLTPELISCPSISIGSEMTSTSRRASAAGRLARSNRHCRMANSSPPSRAMVSSSRDRAADALRDGAEQLVADRMAERVVDALEVVEVEIEHRQRLAACDSTRASPSAMLLAEQHAVRQVGQRVVARHVGDALLGAMPLGDVLVDRDPAALRHRLVRDLDHAPVGEMAMHDQIARLERCHVGVVELVGGDVAVAVVAERDAVLDDLAHRHARAARTPAAG